MNHTKKCLVGIAAVAVVLVASIAAVNPQTPPPATGVSVTNTANGVRVSWNNDAATVHRVGWAHDVDARAANAAGDWLEAFHFADTKRNTDYTIKYLPEGQKYWVIVGAANTRFGAAAWSEWTSLTVGAPAAISPTPVPTPEASSARISLSDTDNSRGYQLTVVGSGFNNGATAAVFVLNRAPTGNNEFAKCDDIMRNGANVGESMVGNDGRVAVTFVVTAPTFKAGTENYICVADSEGRAAFDDIEQFHLEPTIRAVPSAVSAGDTVTVFAQDYPTPSAALTQILLAGLPVPAATSTPIGADYSGQTTFVVPSGFAGIVRVEVTWGNVKEVTRITIVAPVSTPTTPRASCTGDDYDRDEWGSYPAVPADATAAWTLSSDNVNNTSLTHDHHVALKDAHVSGGCNWSASQKDTFSSDLDNLNPTTGSFNSSKGSRTPDRLTGIAKRIIDTDAEKCDYATQHKDIKDEYGLSMTTNERTTVNNWLALCSNYTSGWRSPTPTELAELKQLMLELTNAERIKHSAPPVALGDNPSPQIHAEQGLANCYSSHWDLWGFKPLYRYALAGGDQYTAENGWGIDYCPKDSDNYRIVTPADWRDEVRDAVAGWISSPGHHRNLVDPRHSVMHAGIAIGKYGNSNMVQVFSGDYVDWTSSPGITDGTLAATGQMSDAFYDEDDSYLLTTIEYHPPTNRLTPGQLAGTYCLELDIRVGALLPPLQPGWYYTDENGHKFTDYSKYNRDNAQCVNPYELPADRQPPVSWADANAHHAAAVAQSNAMPDQVSVAYKVVSDLLDISSDGREFSIRADLSPILSHYGPGIYTVTIWATTPDGESNPVAKYPIWWQTMPTSGHPY